MPKKLKAIFVLESPPQGHGYFYNPEGRISEVLFRAFMKLIKFSPSDKNSGLEQLSKKGYILVNPIYIPVNKLPDKQADVLILRNYKKFINDLDKIVGKNKNTPIILIKSNILKILEAPMLKDGYNIINNGNLIPFPLHYHINSFLKKTNKLLDSIGSKI